MHEFEDCPECGKTLSKKKVRCNCGWNILDENEIATSDDRCQYQTSEWRCNEIGRYGPRGIAGKWYCFEHWYQQVNGRNKF